MRFQHHPALRCPLDGGALDLADGALRCADGHSFDLARQGYANLLSARDKRSRDPGDSRAMVAARHRFLAAGYFQSVADGLVELILPSLQERGLVIDAGCGEGYYLQALRDRVLETGLDVPQFAGFDISKWAMQAAARRFPATWLVASNRNIPFADESADLLMDLFGFPDFPSFARVLKPAGLLARVQPAEDHLIELRRMIYPRITDRKTPGLDVAGFERIRGMRIQTTIELQATSAINDLLLMTPHFFRASAEGRRLVAGLERMTLSVHVFAELFRRR